jgi:hypothetical protein
MRKSASVDEIDHRISEIGNDVSNRKHQLDGEGLRCFDEGTDVVADSLVGIVYLPGQTHAVESAMCESSIDEIVSQPFTPLDVEEAAEVLLKDPRQHGDHDHSRRE